VRSRLAVGASAVALAAFCAGCASTPTAIPEGTVVLTTVETGAPTTVTVTQAGPTATGSAVTVTATQTVTETATPTATEQTGATETTDTGSADDTAKFGSAYTWTDGMKVKISKPADFKPGEYAAGTDNFDAFVVFTITITNGSKKKYDPSLFYMTVQSGDQEGDAVFDSEKGVGGTPNTAVLPGRSVSFKQAFGVKDPKDNVDEVSPGFDYDSAIFTT
jgi:hypothetical protein